VRQFAAPQCCADQFGHPHGTLVGCIGKHNCKFLTAKARHQVCRPGDHFLDGLGNLLETTVSAEVPICIVEGLEEMCIRDRSTIDLGTCTSNGGSSNASTPVRYEVAPSYHSPYTGQAGASVERQISSGISATLTYLHSFGVHQLVTRNADQAIGGTPQDSSGGYLYEFFPEAVFKQNQLITSVNAKVGKNLNLMGFYTAGWANSNGGAGSNASNAYNLDQDYGRAGFVSRNMLFFMANYSAPWGIRVNPFMIAQSGRPFNITLPTDSENNFYNQRPALALSLIHI